MGLLIILSILVSVPGLLGKDKNTRPSGIVDEDRERAPLLDDQ